TGLRRSRPPIARLVALLLTVLALAVPATAAGAADPSTTASVHGTVTAADTGQPLPGVAVLATGPGYANVTTAADGSYTVTGLAAGDYRVWFQPAPGAPDVGQYFGGSTDWNAATVVTLAAGATRTGVDTQLGPAATISGRVTGPDGQAVAGVNV